MRNGPLLSMEMVLRQVTAVKRYPFSYSFSSSSSAAKARFLLWQEQSIHSPSPGGSGLCSDCKAHTVLTLLETFCKQEFRQRSLQGIAGGTYTIVLLQLLLTCECCAGSK
jgi:hypothetical protein